MLRWFMQGCCGSFSSPGRSDVPFWTRISKWTSLCAAGAFTSRAADYTVSPVVALAQLSCAVAVFFFFDPHTKQHSFSGFVLIPCSRKTHLNLFIDKTAIVFRSVGHLWACARQKPRRAMQCLALSWPRKGATRFHNAEASASLLRGFCDSRMPSPVVEGLHATSVRIF